MDFQEVISNDDTTEHTLVITEQSHVSGTRDGDPKGKPSSLQAKVWLLGAKLVQETHVDEALLHCRLVTWCSETVMELRNNDEKSILYIDTQLPIVGVLQGQHHVRSSTCGVEAVACCTCSRRHSQYIIRVHICNVPVHRERLGRIACR